jgi:hypothetical protein
MAANDPGGVLQIVQRGDWRQALANDYTATASRLLTAYQNILPNLRDSAAAFTGRLHEWEAANPDSTLSSGDVQGFSEYSAFLRRVQIEMDDFAKLIGDESGKLQGKAIPMGTQAASDSAIRLSGGLAPVIQTQWNRPAPETLQTLINYVDGDAFRYNVNGFSDNAAQDVADTILASVAQGKNPSTIARILDNWFAIPFSWGDNMARTVQLYSYRAANHATFAANDNLLNGWVWIASIGDPRTCMSCISQHGSVHKVTETLNDHHAGRCSPAPWVKGTTWPELIIDGPSWFESQPESAQQTMMGGAMFNAWKSGAMKWQDMSQPYHDDVYGEMLREASVSGVLGKEEAQTYYVRNQSSTPG